MIRRPSEAKHTWRNWIMSALVVQSGLLASVHLSAVLMVKFGYNSFLLLLNISINCLMDTTLTLGTFWQIFRKYNCVF